jgi:hypothetical protein
MGKRAPEPKMDLSSLIAFNHESFYYRSGHDAWARKSKS